ncbi:hypothetical protein D9V84_01220 [Bacteroidetes/Chlorobi group bacterium Naka2016]|nr:MAG: hypothetical protein D9V84_01220 [Bacteroidetes/Chlorobi group bacterium Naka2016]
MLNIRLLAIQNYYFKIFVIHFLKIFLKFFILKFLHLSKNFLYVKFFIQVFYINYRNNCLDHYPSLLTMRLFLEPTISSSTPLAWFKRNFNFPEKAPSPRFYVQIRNGE